jgi:hypothetical protein
MQGCGYTHYLCDLSMTARAFKTLMFVTIPLILAVMAKDDLSAGSGIEMALS